MSERFFSEAPITGESATLIDSEAHHLLHVMRLKAGAEVTLFDGSGAEFEAVVTQCGRRDVQLAVQARHETDRELPAPLVVGVALPKGDRQRWLVEKLTELGVTAIVPLMTEFSGSSPSDKSLDKLRRAVIEASKQCRRNRLMQIAQPQSWQEFAVSDQADGTRLIAHPPEPNDRGKFDFGSIASGAAIAIGPEGGFSDDEVTFAKENAWQCVSLGPRILRTETAAVAAATLVAHTLNRRS